MRREGLITARARRNWTLEEASVQIGCAANTLDCWELGMMSPSAYNRRKLCEVYQTSLDELDLAPRITNTSSIVYQEYVHVDLTLRSLTLLSSTAAKDIQQAFIHELQEHQKTCPAQDRERQEALQRIALFPFVHRQQAADEMIKLYILGVTACAYLGDDGQPEHMKLASSLLSEYIQGLEMLAQGDHRHRKHALLMIAQCFNIKQRLAYHLESLQAVLQYAEQAVYYARQADSILNIVMALRELASVYEWPLSFLPAHTRKKKALEMTQEALFLMKRVGNLSPLIRSWVLIGCAKFQALHGLKEEAYCSAEEAKDIFAQKSQNEDIPGFHLTLPNLTRQEAIMYAYLGDQQKALQVFAQLIDLDEAESMPKMEMHARMYVGLLSEATMASLKLPPQHKDKELSLSLWNRLRVNAQSLKSATYVQEAALAYQIMESVWSDDVQIQSLRNAL